MRSRTPGQRRNGQSMVELTAGLFVLIPIVLAILDLVVIVLGQEANNDLAKRAARAASHHETSAKAQAAVDDVISKFGASGLLSNPTKVDFQYNANGNVVVETSVQINLPVPVPFADSYNHQVMHAKATEPIVGLPPE